VPSLPLRKGAFKPASLAKESLLKPKLVVLELTRTRAPEIHLPQDEMDFTLRQAAEQTGASGAAIALSTGVGLCCVASYGNAPPLATRVDPDRGLTGLCFHAGEALLCRDTEHDSRVDVEACRSLRIRSVLVVPLVKEGASCGILELLSPMPQRFTESHVMALIAMADGLMANRPRVECSLGESNPEVGAGNRYFQSSFARQKHSPWPRTVMAAVLVALSVIGYNGKLRNFEADRLAKNGSPRVPTRKMLPAPARQVLLSITEDDVAHTQARIRGSFSSADLDTVHARASAGDARAAYDLGERYADGAGVKPDFYQAMNWFAKAADKGEASAQWKLGLGYLNGIGVPQDDAKAVEWFVRAANQAHIGAQVALSELYFDGRGVPQDYVRAYTWATIAAQTTSGGKEYLKAMAAQMTPTELNETNHRVKAWWEHHATPLPR